MVRKHILLVEDDKQTSELVRFMLEQSGYVVKVTHDGFGGVELARQLAFDLIVLDIGLPKLDGYSVLETFRKMPECEDTPIVMLTGRDDAKSIKRATEKGAVDYLVKPPEKDVLAQRIGSILADRPMPREFCFEKPEMPSLGKLTYDIKILSMNEIGMIVLSPVPLPEGESLSNLSFNLFADLEIEAAKLRIVECRERDGQFEVYMSFVDMPELAPPKIREWVNTKCLEKRLEERLEEREEEH